ncbi:uncharacterized protein LOC109613415 [Musca domestica]|uniref:Uncharacterized protein LOC109613415 n=1 Tax=Musca domestica TaxID=7370 RepID=A0A9J7DLC0_MUSDO|nr:uncharacterized protein LOC109613415 [Musca domestica]
MGCFHYFFFALVLFNFRSQAVTFGPKYTRIGDVYISTFGNTFYCDKIQCPAATTYDCLVFKEINPENPATTLRSNICRFLNGRRPQKLAQMKVLPKDKMQLYIRAKPNGEVKVLS